MSPEKIIQEILAKLKALEPVRQGPLGPIPAVNAV